MQSLMQSLMTDHKHQRSLSLALLLPPHQLKLKQWQKCIMTMTMIRRFHKYQWLNQSHQSFHRMRVVPQAHQRLQACMRAALLPRGESLALMTHSHGLTTSCQHAEKCFQMASFHI